MATNILLNVSLLVVAPLVESIVAAAVAPVV
jgi:hypothetical protein